MNNTITLGEITYEVRPFKATQLCYDFNKYLDELDANIYNESIEEYGKHFNLKYFSDLYTKWILDDKEYEELLQCIKVFKLIVKDVVQKQIIKLTELLHD